MKQTYLGCLGQIHWNWPDQIPRGYSTYGYYIALSKAPNPHTGLLPSPLLLCPQTYSLLLFMPWARTFPTPTLCSSCLAVFPQIRHGYLAPTIHVAHCLLSFVCLSGTLSLDHCLKLQAPPLFHPASLDSTQKFCVIFMSLFTAVAQVPKQSLAQSSHSINICWKKSMNPFDMCNSSSYISNKYISLWINFMSLIQLQRPGS